MGLEAARATEVSVGAPHAARSPAAPAPRWFAAFFALAVAAHIVGNPAVGLDTRGIVTLALGATALALVWWPAKRWLWAGVALLQLWTVWLEAPVVGNHWVLMGFFSVAVLLALPRMEPWPWLATAVGVSFVTFYAFAAFAKLNTAFLDPATSCAVFYADQGLRSWGLPSLPAGTVLAAVPIAAALLIELSVPVLLAIPRTRAAGVALAAGFHYVISLDLAQHFYDFTAVIFVGLAVFAGAAVTRPVGNWMLRRPRTVAIVCAFWAVLIVAAVVPRNIVSLVLIGLIVFVLWVPLGAAVVWLALRGVRGAAVQRLGRLDLAAAGLVLLVALNGVLPYVGVKTAFGWNMYANLVTVDGRTNHLVVPSMSALAAAEYVRVTATSDEELAQYVGTRWAVPERNVRDHLAARPDAIVVFERSDGTVVSGSGRRLGRPLPEVVRRLLPLRSVDRSVPSRCQALWLPAL